MLYGNPVHGTIHPATWKRPIGNVDFRVTQAEGCTGILSEPPLGSCPHFHRGLDLGNARCGDDVLAAHDGVVKKSGSYTEAGMPNPPQQFITINHGGGHFTIYGHLATRSVVSGQAVKQGQKIGTVGKSGATACHLHFGMKVNVDPTRNVFADDNGQWVNPWPFLVQNVTIHPTMAGINIRVSAGTAGTYTVGKLYAETKADGLIHRASDDVELGPTLAAHPWGGTVVGATYGSLNTWEKMYLDGAWRYVASPYTVKSES
jgi:murein DD-endopeptidase MepM/ murein hydrolase activator NlpD